MKRYFLSDEEKKYILNEEMEFGKTISGKRASLLLRLIIRIGLITPLFLILASVIIDFVNAEGALDNIANLLTIGGIVSFIINLLIIFASRIVYESMLFNYINNKK